jgi:hypothetical protein
MEEMLGAVITIIKTKKDLYIFYEGKRKNTRDKTINTNESLMPVIINKIVPYQNLKEMRQSYGIDN